MAKMARRVLAAGVVAAACWILSMCGGRWFASQHCTAFTPGLENLPDGSPKLYGYDHSHYTVRCRMALGLKQMPYRMIWVAEDDAETPTELVGRKITPIIEFPGEAAFPESSDIIARVEADEAYGPPRLAVGTERPELDAWLKQVGKPMRNLGRPRYIRSSMLPEFRSKSARERFMTTHPLPDPVSGETLGKPEWAALPADERRRVYEHYWGQTDELLKQLNTALEVAEKHIASDKHVSEHGLSWDDIIFFSRLRGLTLIKGVKLPPALDAYLETMSDMTDVPLLTQLAM